MSCRTGIDMNVALPDARNLVELSNSKVTLGCAVEFENYVMLAMEGQRVFRFRIDYDKFEEIVDHKNVIFVELAHRMSAYEFCQVAAEYGDVYVVKDALSRFFIEF